jgi:hypothetical protein
MVGLVIGGTGGTDASPPQASLFLPLTFPWSTHISHDPTVSVHRASIGAAQRQRLGVCVCVCVCGLRLIRWALCSRVHTLETLVAGSGSGGSISCGKSLLLLALIHVCSKRIMYVSVDVRAC